MFGHASFLVSFIFVVFSLRWFGKMEAPLGWSRVMGIIIAFLSVSSFLALFLVDAASMRFYRGGIVGLIFSDFLINYFGTIGAYVIITSLGLLSLPLVAEISIVPLFSLAKEIVLSVRKIQQLRFPSLPKVVLPRVRMPARAKPFKAKSFEDTVQPAKQPLKTEKELLPVKKETSPRIVAPNIKIAEAQSVPQTKTSAPRQPKVIEDENYVLPSMDLLESPPPVSMRQIKDDLQANAHILKETLDDFGISAEVVNIERGPVATRYELEPAPGVKIQKIVALSNDIALAMKASSVRMVAPIPGKAAVGVEIPNSHSTVVYLKEVLSNQEFSQTQSKLTLALGIDISGQPIIADLAEMPHLLIAGTTGSGKTVCVNTIIMSMLFNATPSEVKFLMVDPKMVELAPFNGLPHLLCPVVTNAKKAASALNWVVNTMDDRYQVLAKEGVRNIEHHNGKCAKEERMPYIVVIIDELADLMMVARDQIENAITRLAQLSRAVGIHLILATQRPSVDVITGVIKANFPARVSFKVASKVDSRTVLDMNGADKLLGRGDMLFLRPGEAKLVRAQGSFVQDKEIEKVTDFISKQMEPVYDESILKEQEKDPVMGNFEEDELYDTAVKLVLEMQHASVSVLQRKLRLGYARAARLVDMMEERGVVGPFRGSKPREILVDKESYFNAQQATEEQQA